MPDQHFMAATSQQGTESLSASRDPGFIRLVHQPTQFHWHKRTGATPHLVTTAIVSADERPQRRPFRTDWLKRRILLQSVAPAHPLAFCTGSNPGPGCTHDNVPSDRPSAKVAPAPVECQLATMALKIKTGPPRWPCG